MRMPPSSRRGLVGMSIKDGKIMQRLHPQLTTQYDLDRQRPPPPPPPAIPDWGEEPAASRWIRIPQPHPEYELKNLAQWKVSKRDSILIWNLGLRVKLDRLRRLYTEAGSIVSIFYNESRHLAIVDFMSPGCAARGLHRLVGSKVMHHLAKFSFFDNDAHLLDRDASSLMEIPGRLNCTVCIEGFDSSLHVEEIRTMLARHFSSDGKGIIVLKNPKGSSIGKAYIKCESSLNYSEALSLNGSELGGYKLCVSQGCGCNKMREGKKAFFKNVSNDVREIWCITPNGRRITPSPNGHRITPIRRRITPIGCHITPNGPGIGKKIVFNSASDDEYE